MVSKFFVCSKTSSSERAMAIGLGGLNLFGVIVLGAMLKYGYLDWILLLWFLSKSNNFPAIPFLKGCRC